MSRFKEKPGVVEAEEMVEDGRHLWIFFDVNPEKRRTYARYRKHSHISFGPEMEVVVRGLDGLERVITRHRNQ